MNEKSQIEKLQDLIDIQCTDGNWDYSPYMFGLANGLIMAMSLLTNESPEFLDAPEYYLCTLKELDKFNNSPIIVHAANEQSDQNEAT